MSSNLIKPKVTKLNASPPRKWENHPFGFQVARFENRGLHPSLFRTIANDRTPCDYDPKPIKCVRKSNIFNWQPWQIENELQEFSKNLGYEHVDILEFRKFMRKQLGPGSHDINMALFKQYEVSPCKNQNLGKQKRFRRFEKVSPGPARYNVKPYSLKVPHEGTTFGCSARFKELSKPWNLPCNRYTVKYPDSLDALLNKVVSLRGPYDCFTGPREPDNMFNKFSEGRKCTPDKYYLWPSNMDVLLHHPQFKVKGRFNKAPRFLSKPVMQHLQDDISTCYHNPEWPGPANYVLPEGITAAKEAKYAFGLSSPEVRPGLKWKLSPGPASYQIKYPKCIGTMKKNPTSVFISKTHRTEYKAPVYNAF